MNEQKHIVEIFIIKTFIFAKIFWYYEFEKIMNEKSNVTFVFFSKFEQSNRRNFRTMNSNNELIEKNNDFDDDKNVETIFDNVWFFIQTKTFDDDNSNNFFIVFTFDENNDNAIVDETNKNVRKKRIHVTRINDFYVRFDIFETNVLNNTLNNFTNFQNLNQNIFFCENINREICEIRRFHDHKNEIFEVFRFRFQNFCFCFYFDCQNFCENRIFQKNVTNVHRIQHLTKLTSN